MVTDSSGKCWGGLWGCLTDVLAWGREMDRHSNTSDTKVRHLLLTHTLLLVVVFVIVLWLYCIFLFLFLFLLFLFLRATLRLILLFKYRSRISTSPAVPSVDRSKAHAVPQDVIPSADGKPVAYKGARTGKIIRSLHGGELSNLVMVWCMCWRHTVVGLCVCLFVCLSVCWFLKFRGKLSADTCNIGTTQ